jgi:ATP-binding cassette, sub-family E, member 1
MNKGTRLVIVDPDACKPKKCDNNCQSACPVNRSGKMCIDIEDVAKITEWLCIGCNICTKKCPFHALQIVKLPENFNDQTVHRFGTNGFKLCNLPRPKRNRVLGILGQNGIGKSTIAKIMTNEFKPNFGLEQNDICNSDIIKNFRGTELQNFFTSMYDDKTKFKASIKTQLIDSIPAYFRKKKINPKVSTYFLKYKSHPLFEKINNVLNIETLFDKHMISLSGGELQRICCAKILFQDVNVYIIDEPTNYLDIEYRLRLAYLISELSLEGKYFIIIDHDLAFLDYVSDNICVMFGEAGAYGYCSTSYGSGRAINCFFKGFLPSENVRFRTKPYKISFGADVDSKRSDISLSYEEGNVSYSDPNFNLHINSGKTSNVTFVLGKNGTGKSTFLNFLNDNLKYCVSYKKQYLDISQYEIAPGYYDTVQNVLNKNIQKSLNDSFFDSEIFKPLQGSKLSEKHINELSGGELQRFSLILALGRDADVYLLDEPSAFLDVEQRSLITQILKRFFLKTGKNAFIVEHDIMFTFSLASECHILFSCEVDKKTNQFEISEPLDFEVGIHKFLENVNITFRRDKVTGRPRMNKYNSAQDKEQKKNKCYFKF